MAKIKIRVRAKPPFLRLRPGLDIDRSRHRPVIGCYRSNSYLNLSHENGYVGLSTLAAATGNHICYDTTTISGMNTFTTCTSSIRYKENLTAVGDVSGLLTQTVYNFKWKNKNETGTGLIAEFLNKTNPECVEYYHGNISGINYDCVTAELLEIVKQKDLQNEVSL